jgi:hypothetical protein
MATDIISFKCNSILCRVLVVTALNLKNIVFWGMKSCTLTEINRRLGRIYYLKLESWRARQASKSKYSWMPVLQSDLENGGRKIPRNIIDLVSHKIVLLKYFLFTTI